MNCSHFLLTKIIDTNIILRVIVAQQTLYKILAIRKLDFMLCVLSYYDS